MKDWVDGEEHMHRNDFNFVLRLVAEKLRCRDTKSQMQQQRVKIWTQTLSLSFIKHLCFTAARPRPTPLPPPPPHPPPSLLPRIPIYSFQLDGAAKLLFMHRAHSPFAWTYSKPQLSCNPAAAVQPAVQQHRILTRVNLDDILWAHEYNKDICQNRTRDGIRRERRWPTNGGVPTLSMHVGFSQISLQRESIRLLAPTESRTMNVMWSREMVLMLKWFWWLNGQMVLMASFLKRKKITLEFSKQRFYALRWS